MVELEVLASGDVALAERGVLLGHYREGVHLLRRDATERQLDADHLARRLALTVHALLQPEADELQFLALTCKERVGLRREVIEFLIQDRDHITR